tara:strand:+ start:317 stop:751 length:435 start_codon:yes stop_codon:yes gene_type:complete
MRSLFEIIDNRVLYEKEIQASESPLENLIGSISAASGNVPISVEASKWTTLQDPERLARKFEFEDYRKLKVFLNELLDHQENVKHHADISVEHRSIVVETYTHDVNKVTELDQELAKFCDELFKDVDHYFITDGEEEVEEHWQY